MATWRVAEAWRAGLRVSVTSSSPGSQELAVILLTGSVNAKRSVSVSLQLHRRV